MSAENSSHITKVNASLAATSGALIGVGAVVFPPAIGLGVAVGAAGYIRERGHQNDIKVQKHLEEVRERMNRKVVPNPYADLDTFRLRAFRDIPGVVTVYTSSKDSTEENRE